MSTILCCNVSIASWDCCSFCCNILYVSQKWFSWFCILAFNTMLLSDKFWRVVIYSWIDASFFSSSLDNCSFSCWRTFIFFSVLVLFIQQSEFVERFPELSLFYELSSPLDSEMICIFPYFCPYEESAREIRDFLFSRCLLLYQEVWRSSVLLFL